MFSTLPRSITAPVAEELEAVRRTTLDELRQTDGELLNAMARHLEGMQGKMIRPLLLLLSAGACGRKPGEADIAAATAAEMIHTATLVHDDVIDGSHMRRRRESINERWGNGLAVLLGDYMLARAFTMLSAAGAGEALAILAETAALMCRGEIRQRALARSTRPDETAYLEVIEDKTASLFAACCRIGALGADPRQAELLGGFGRELGLAFQIIDDVRDILADEAVGGKPVRADIGSGWLTLPLIHVLSASNGQADRLQGLRLEASMDEEAAQRLAAEVVERGGLDYAGAAASDRLASAARLAAELEPSPFRQGLLDLVELFRP